MINWTKKKLFDCVKKCTTKKEFYLNYNNAYRYAHRVNLLNECYEFLKGRKPNGYWTSEKILESTEKYDNYLDWIKNEKTVYQASLRIVGCLEDVKKRFKSLKEIRLEKNFQRYKGVAKKCKSKKEFREKFHSSYLGAHRLDLLERIYLKMRWGKVRKWDSN